MGVNNFLTANEKSKKHTDDLWTTTDINRIFKINSTSSLISAESKGLIPKADRTSRGQVRVRQWTTAQLPEIGKLFGFLKKPASPQIICVYTPKGGVLKTTFSYNLARTLALNGISTLIVGLDTIQESITTCALPTTKIESLEQLEDDERPGLYHHFFEKMPLESIIRKTSLPTLDIIPENPELAQLEFKLRAMPRREYFFNEKLIKKLNYDVIVFDNGSGWNELVVNSITASNVILCPMGCSLEAYRALKKNLSLLFEFKEEMKLNWDLIQIPTLLERNKISNQIYGAYLNEYKENTLAIPIKSAVAGQEASAFHRCVIEHDPSSSLADDYYRVIDAIWSKINS